MTERKRPGPPAQRAAAAPSTVRSVAPTRLFLPGKPEEQKVVNFWNHVGAGDTRKLSRLITPDSPLAALVRLYGPAGPLNGINVPAGHTPMKFTCGNYDQPVAGQCGGTTGELHTHHGEYRYLLLWSPDKLLEENPPLLGALAGAEAIHLHPRDLHGVESLQVDDVATAVSAVRDACPDVPVACRPGCGSAMVMSSGAW